MIKGNTITWKLTMASSRERVFNMLSTDEGRSSFWAESAEEKNGFIHFLFPNGQQYKSRIINSIPDEVFCIEYFGSQVTFSIDEAEDKTILTLVNEEVDDKEIIEVNAGWVSVLMTLKGACDHGIDLRNHSKEYNWDEGYVGN